MFLSAGPAPGRRYKGERRHVRVFDLVGGCALTNSRVFCTVADDNGVPDGIRCDARGNLWVCVGQVVALSLSLSCRVSPTETLALRTETKSAIDSGTIPILLGRSHRF
jgi:hypothetical protein